MNTPLIQKAMRALRAEAITLSDFNEILMICVGLGNFTVTYTVYRFFKDNGVETIPESTGWYITVPDESSSSQPE